MKSRDARVAAAAISGLLVRQIAADEKVTERQVFRVLAKPEVKEAVDRGARENFRSASLRIQGAAYAAASSLETMCGAKRSPDANRIRACLGLLNLAARFGENAELKLRIEAIEKAIEGLQRERRGRAGFQ